MHKLLQDFSKEKLEKHLSGLQNIDGSRIANIFTLFSERWTKMTSPQIVCSFLADSYCHLPLRPDLAFNILWSALNRSYHDMYLVQKGSSVRSFTDKDAIDLFLISLKDLRLKVLPDGRTIGNILDLYYSKITLKNLNFVSQIVLRGFAEEASGISEIYHNKTYSKSKNSELVKTIRKFYYQGYTSNCTAKISPNKTGVEYEFKSIDKSRNAVSSLSETLKDLITNKKVVFSYLDLNETVEFTDEDIDSFIFRNIVYANRNNILHARSSPRLTSENFKHVYFKSETYLYYVTHMYLSLMLNILDYLDDEEMYINFQNFDLLENLLDEPLPTLSKGLAK